MANILSRLGLKHNPFPTAATGAPLTGELSPPEDLAKRVREVIHQQESGQGVKAATIIGEYGTGKTYLLQWLQREIFPDYNIESFYFENPGTQFYDLANGLLRGIGRTSFSKMIWELASHYINLPVQRSLFSQGYEEYIQSTRGAKNRNMIAEGEESLRSAIQAAEITRDEEIAHRLAKIVAEAGTKPYFEYKDFVPRHARSLAATGQEGPYFEAILRTLSQAKGTRASAFVIDEFEDIALQTRITKQAARDYLFTLKRLIDLAESKETPFWLILSMTPNTFEITQTLQPALKERIFSEDRVIQIAPLRDDEAIKLVAARLAEARPEDSSHHEQSCFPFPDRPFFQPATRSNPRRLIQSCRLAIAKADETTTIPFRDEYLDAVEAQRPASRTNTEK